MNWMRRDHDYFSKTSQQWVLKKRWPGSPICAKAEREPPLSGDPRSRSTRPWPKVESLFPLSRPPGSMTSMFSGRCPFHDLPRYWHVARWTDTLEPLTRPGMHCCSPTPVAIIIFRTVGPVVQPQGTLVARKYPFPVHRSNFSSVSF
jgi:hypothetical protein